MKPPPQPDAKRENSTAPDLAPPNQSEILTKELMLCLSKEIETTATIMMAFRTKVGFGMFVGPFLLLGSFIVGAKGQPVSFNLNWYGWAALGVDIICFLGIAYIASQIEAQALRQCNRWRRLIGELRRNPSMQIDSTQLELNLRWRRWNGAEAGYLVGYFLLFLSVAAAVVIILQQVSPVQP
jgi:hypothetical protein